MVADKVADAASPAMKVAALMYFMGASIVVQLVNKASLSLGSPFGPAHMGL